MKEKESQMTKSSVFVSVIMLLLAGEWLKERLKKEIQMRRENAICHS